MAEAKAAELTGSRHLQRYSQNIIMFERNLHADGDQKNVGKIRLVKCRETGDTGWLQTHYNRDTTRIIEVEKGFQAEGGEGTYSDIEPDTNPFM